MKKLKKSLYLVLILFLFFNASFASALLEISEIMYDAEGTDTNNEWIEIYNNGSDSVDLSNISIADYDTSWHFHGVVPDASSILNGGSYAIITTSSKLPDFISNFKSKWSNVNPLFLRASFSLLNESGELSLSSDKKTTYSEVSYSTNAGASGNGYSYQKINGSWKASMPTPGGANTVSSSNNNDVTTNLNINTNTSESTKLASKENQKPELRVEILTQNTASAGIDLQIDASVTMGSNVYKVGKLVWNFGDGTTLVQSSFEKFTHRYKYVGDYVMTLNYMSNGNIIIPEATDRMVISVLEPGVVISRIGDANDYFVELENNSKYEILLSNWILKNGEEVFGIPEGTIILPNKKLIFGSDVTHFVFNTNQSVSLYKPQGQLTYTYGAKVSKSITNSVSTSSEGPTNQPKENNIINLTENSLSANAKSSTKNNPNNMPIITFCAVVLVIFGIYVSYFFIHKKEEPVDSLLSDNDIKIIE